MEKEVLKKGSEIDTVLLVEHLLGGGTMLPEQWLSGTVWSPEKELASAVLMDALVEVREYSGHPLHKHKAREDLEWIFSDDTESPYSFVRLCELLGLDPVAIRKIMWNWIAGPEAGWQN